MEELDLTKILKDCPKGTELYSTIHGVVTLEGVSKSRKTTTECSLRVLSYPIITKSKNGTICQFTSNGLFYDHFDGECILFPSKDNRDWSTFKVEKPKFNINCLKPFDKVLVRDESNGKWTCSFFSYLEKDKIYPFITVAGICGFKQCIPYRNETAKLLGTTNPCPEYYKNWD